MSFDSKIEYFYGLWSVGMMKKILFNRTDINEYTITQNFSG